MISLYLVVTVNRDNVTDIEHDVVKAYDEFQAFNEATGCDSADYSFEEHCGVHIIVGDEYTVTIYPQPE